MVKISPSILASDFSRLGQEVQAMESAGVDMVHIDVMDGHFVPNISFGMPVIKSLRPVTNLIFDVHLMISDPLRYLGDFVKAGADMITFHLESDSDVKASFEKYVKEQIIPSVRDTEILNILWNELFEKAVVLSYPQSELDYFYNSYVEQYKYYMEYYSYFCYTFADLNDFVEQYLGLEKGADWQAMTREQCEVDVMQNLLFHAIAQKENISITQTDYQNSINYYIDYYKNNGYNYTAAQIEESVGSRLLKEHALFEKVQALLIENCTVIYSADVDGGSEKVEESTSESVESESVESESTESSSTETDTDIIE